MDRTTLLNKTYLLFVGQELEPHSFKTIGEVKDFLRITSPPSFFIYKHFSNEDLWSEEYEIEEKNYRYASELD